MTNDTKTRAREKTISQQEAAFRDMQVKELAGRTIHAAGRNASPEDLKALALAILTEAERKGGAQ